MRFAMAETLAHLEYLATQGRIEQIEHDGGQYSWRRCTC
jgi:hypothetical protein